MKFKIFMPRFGNAEYEEEPVEYVPMSDERFSQLVHLGYALIGTAGMVAALYLVGKIALLALVPIFILSLFKVVD